MAPAALTRASRRALRSAVLGRPHHVERERRLFLAASHVQLGVRIRNRLRRIELEPRDDVADCGRISLDLDEGADRGGVQGDDAALPSPLLAPLLLAEATFESETFQDGGDFFR